MVSKGLHKVQAMSIEWLTVVRHSAAGVVFERSIKWCESVYLKVSTFQIGISTIIMASETLVIYVAGSIFDSRLSRYLGESESASEPCTHSYTGIELYTGDRCHSNRDRDTGERLH